MILIWIIDTLTADNQRSRVFLYCRTSSIRDPISRCQLEFLAAVGNERSHKLLDFRKHFNPQKIAIDDEGISTVFIDDYWEDENGNTVPPKKAWNRLFKIPEHCIRLSSTETHWLNLQVSLLNREPLFGSSVPKLADYEIRQLRLFMSDAEELHRSRFYSQQSSFSLSHRGDEPYKLVTIDAEHIGHFVALFRKLFAQSEHANYIKLSQTIGKHFRGTPFGEWQIGDREKLDKHLSSNKVGTWPINDREFSFNNEKLVYAFLYSKYLHQPDVEAENSLRKMAAEFGGFPQLEAAFFFVSKQIAAHFINWGGWVKNLLKCLELEAPETGMSKVVTRTEYQPELRLSPKVQGDFEAISAELAFALHKTDEEGSSTPPIDYLKRAKSLLREVL